MAKQTNGYSVCYMAKQTNGYTACYVAKQTNGYSACYMVKQTNGYIACYVALQTNGYSACYMAKVYQHGGEAVLDKLQNLFTNCWEKGTLPQDLRDAVIVSLYKDKEEKSDCSNYREITLLSIAGKILARVEKHARKPVWVQVQQRDHRHDLHAEADTGEMQKTEHQSICSFHRPDQGI